MTKVLLDTNGYTKLLAGDTSIRNFLGEADVIYLSVVALGELYAGFRCGLKEQENRKILKKFLGKPLVAVLDCTEETSEIFGEIKCNLKREGKPIPINDIWITANAIESGSVLITCDNHFKDIAGLRLWRPQS